MAPRWEHERCFFVYFNLFQMIQPHADRIYECCTFSMGTSFRRHICMYVQQTQRAYKIIVVVIREILICNPVAGEYCEKYCTLRHQIMHAFDLPRGWHLTHFHITGKSTICIDEILCSQLRLLRFNKL